MLIIKGHRNLPESMTFELKPKENNRDSPSPHTHTHTHIRVESVGKCNSKKKPTKCSMHGSRGKTTHIIKKLKEIQCTNSCEIHTCSGI